VTHTSNFAAKIRDIYSIESISSGNSVLHRLHPGAKITATAFFLAVVVSFGRYDFSRPVPLLSYPVLAAALGGVPYALLLRRFSLALPFCLLAGTANLYFDRAAAFTLGGVAVSFGILSLFSILLRAFLCVMAVLILAAATPFTHLTAQLERMRVPSVLITLFEVTYRYLGTLIDEASSMYTAYSLRCGGESRVKMRDMGSFAGQLLLRSFDRAERVYAAMKCRGYRSCRVRQERVPFAAADYAYMFLVCGSALLFRLTDVTSAVGRLAARLP